MEKCIYLSSIIIIQDRVGIKRQTNDTQENSIFFRKKTGRHSTLRHRQSKPYRWATRAAQPAGAQITKQDRGKPLKLYAVAQCIV